MADFEDVRRTALSLPASTGDIRFGVLSGGKPRLFAWVWLQRVDPKKGRVPCADVVAIRTADVEERDLLIASDPAKFFTEPHYDGYPAVLVRLAQIDLDELEELLIDAWRCQASRQLREEFDASLRSASGGAER
jgi:hypothetical protein